MFINNNCALLRGIFLCSEFAYMGASFLFDLPSRQALQVSLEA
jgi:hypothetical protein